MLFSQNNKEGTNTKKTPMNFHETQPPDIKRTDASNISKNSNQNLKIGTSAIPLGNLSFEIKPVSTNDFKLHVQKKEKERFVKKVSKQKFVPPSLPPVLPQGVMEVPFPALRTKYTEVVFESNLRDSDQRHIIYFPTEQVEPIVENIMNTKKYVEKHVEDYFIANNISMEEINKQITTPLHERIQKCLESLELQNTMQKKELEQFIEILLQEKTDVGRDSSIPSDYVTKIEVIELIEERIEQESVTKENYATIQSDVTELKTKESETTDLFTAIQSDVTELKTKESVTRKEVIELIEKQESITKENYEAVQSNLTEIKTKDYVTKTEVVELIEERKAAIQSDVTELKTKEYITKTELIELFEERKEQENVTKDNYAAIHSDVTELKTKEYVTKTEVIELIEERKENYSAIITEVLELKTKEYITKQEVVELMEGTYTTKTEVLEIVDGKLYALNMEFLVEKYVTQMIQQGENEENNNTEENDDEPKTKFEEIIQPSVARIIHRVTKYDQSYQPTESLQNSVSVNFEVDDVYDVERQEKGHFTDCEAKGSIYNPMYTNEPTLYKETVNDEIVEMGSVYKGEENGSFQYENELRTVGGDKRWNRFGNGIETGSVIDLFLDKNNRKIYIVGNFKFVNRVPMENIAVYDLNEKKWKHVGEGIPQVATAIAVDEEDEIVYVGGVFSKVGKGECEVKANNVAAYNVKENKWYALGEGLNRDCSSILFDNKNKKLYAGGSFTQSGSKILKYVAMYDIENKDWYPLKGGSVNGPCRVVLKPTEDDLYLGGLFTHAGDDDIHVSYVARYNLEKDSWYSLGGGLQGYCNAITYDSINNKLYVGGTFTSVGSVDDAINANHIAEYDIEKNSWNDMDGGLNNIVQSIFYDANNECVYVGGTFTHSFENNIQLNHIARYDLKESKWHCLENHFPNKKTAKEEDGHDNVGLNGICKVMSVDNKSLFIAGSFQIAGNITANSIVRYSLNS